MASFALPLNQIQIILVLAGRENQSSSVHRDVLRHFDFESELKHILPG